jgi:hypothetical protein
MVVLDAAAVNVCFKQRERGTNTPINIVIAQFQVKVLVDLFRSFSFVLCFARETQ